MPGTYISPAETELYYLQSRYYNPEIGRFINADGLVATGQELIGNNTFAYCGNNPIMRYDPSGTEYRPVGAGFQLEMEIGNAVVGVEIIVFWDVDECVDNNPVIAVYVYGGVSVDTSSNPLLGSIMALITDNKDLLTGINGQVTMGVSVLTSLITKNFSISVSGVVIVGNENFTSTSSYENSFTSIGGGWGKVKGGVAYSDTCYAVSLGGSIVGSRALPGWGVAKTYYQKVFEWPIKSAARSRSQYSSIIRGCCY